MVLYRRKKITNVKPRLVMIKGLWTVWWQSLDGQIHHSDDVHNKSKSTKRGKEARVFAANRNARTVANRRTR